MPKELKLGNYYIIEYNDHFHADRVGSENEDLLHPVVLRAVGRLVAVTPIQYNLEHACEGHDANREYAHSIHGIMRSCVTAVHDFGPGPKE